jgi:hypothetical protein
METHDDEGTTQEIIQPFPSSVTHTHAQPDDRAPAEDDDLDPINEEAPAANNDPNPVGRPKGQILADHDAADNRSTAYDDTQDAQLRERLLLEVAIDVRDSLDALHDLHQAQHEELRAGLHAIAAELKYAAEVMARK